MAKKAEAAGYAGCGGDRGRRGWVESGSGFDAVAHAVAGSLDDHRLGVMQEAVEQGGGQGAVVVEDLGPLLEGAILCTVHYYAEPRPCGLDFQW